VLACGPRAALSDQTAASLWGNMPTRHPKAPVVLTAPRSLRGPATGVRLHRRGRLELDEITKRHRLPLTTPPRTILDLASSLDACEMERVLARALKRNIVGVESLQLLLDRHPRSRGCGRIRTILSAAAEPSFTRSEAEAVLLALLRKGSVPRPLVNAVVAGLEVDFFWPDRGVVVEVDGFAYHSSRNAFENDHRRDSILASENLLVIRFTWRQLRNEPEKVLARLCMALGAHGPKRDAGG